MEYSVVLHEAEEGGYWVEVPVLSGCFSQGETVEQAMQNIRSAISSHIAALTEDHRQPPTEGGILFARVAVA